MIIKLEPLHGSGKALARGKGSTIVLGSQGEERGGGEEHRDLRRMMTHAQKEHLSL